MALKTAYLKYDPDKTLSHISPEIYGHFSEHLGRCIYNGIYVGKDSDISNINGIRKDAVNALKEIGIPVLRWPGGCFADEYHWHDGVGSERKPILNSNWGRVSEDNSFGTHEFFELCELLGCKAYIAGNMGSGSVKELSEWIQYITAPADTPLGSERKVNGHEDPWTLEYLGIGNENWGGGGNMRPEAYADLYRQYQTFAKNYNNYDMVKVACGPNSDDYHWTEGIMQSLKPWHTGAISLHYYTIPTGEWSHKGDAVDFSEYEYYSTIAASLYMDELINRHGTIMDKYDDERKIKLIIDEWGCWYDVEKGTEPGFLYQQNTMRDAIVAAINLNIFNNHSDRVIMANLAQTMNVLQAVLLSDGESLVKTPTWQVFRLFLPHHGAELVRTSCAVPFITNDDIEIPQISCSMSKKNDELFLTLSNISLDEPCSMLIDSEKSGISFASAQIITADVHSFNDFGKEENVCIHDYSGFNITDGKLTLELPPCSVVSVKICG